MNIATLESYLEQKNRWGACFGSKPLSLLSPEDRQKIARMIDSELSPENLTCDGELPPREVQRRYQLLTRAASELASLDASVEFFEL